MRITRLKLSNWRNFKEAELALGERAFFVGPNASGKSNLLDAVRFVRDVATDGKGGLAGALGSRGGVRAVRCLSARRTPDVRLEFDVGDDATPDAWRYVLAFGTKGTSARGVVKEEKVWRAGKRRAILDRPDASDRNDPELLTQTALQQVNLNGGFRELASFFASVRYLNVLPQIVRDPRRKLDDEDPYGCDLLERINATTPKTRIARLKRMQEALSLAVPKLDKLDIEVDAAGAPHLTARYKHWRPHGHIQRESSFSDGTLRLLGLIWALQEKGGPLLLEEPEISLHPAVVRGLAPMIARAMKASRRQSLITTHSSDLLSSGVRESEIFFLAPGEEATEVRCAADDPQLRALIESGMPAGEAVLPRTAAPKVESLTQLELAL